MDKTEDQLYDEILDISCTGSAQFLWERGFLDEMWDCVKGLQLRQSNMVLNWHVVDRATGVLAPLGMGEIEYDRISIVHSLDRFKSQRQLKMMFPASSAALLYFTGKGVIVGAADAIMAVLGIYTACRIQSKFRIKPTREFVIQGIQWVNGVYTGVFRKECDLDMLMRLSGTKYNVTYDAEHFTGASIEDSSYLADIPDDIPMAKYLRYKPGTVVLYKTGKFVCVGVRKPENLEEGFNAIENYLESMPQIHRPIGTHELSRRLKRKAKHDDTEENTIKPLIRVTVEVPELRTEHVLPHMQYKFPRLTRH